MQANDLKDDVLEVLLVLCCGALLQLVRNEGLENSCKP